MDDIMVVDDTPENLKVLGTMLRNQGYKVRTLPSGKLALKAIKLQQPDIILLDISMPDMNGYEVCLKLKSDDRLKEIPVIFISALSDTKDIVRAFRNGGVDYITKPFHIEEVLVRVRTQLEIVQGRRAMDEMLTKTFMGSIRILIDILSTTKPAAFEQASQLKRMVHQITSLLNLSNPWIYEIAAVLSRIGYVVLPEEKLHLYLEGTIGAISSKEHHDAIDFAIELIGKIPRLETVVEILRKWYIVPESKRMELPLRRWSEAEIGVNLIKMALEYNELMNKYKNKNEVIDYMEKRKKNYHPALYKTLVKVVRELHRDDEIALTLLQLEEGMIISRNIFTVDQMKLLSRETELSLNLLNLLKRYHNQEGLEEPIYVWKS